MLLPQPLRAYVIEEEPRKTKAGSLFWQGTLRTKVGIIKALMWDVPDDVATSVKIPHVGDIIQVFEFKDQLETRSNIIIKGFIRITKGELDNDEKCILETDSASEEEMKWAWGIIKDDSFWVDKKYHRFTMKCLKELDQEKLEMSPAASRIHHAYQGGLLIHTAEVLKSSRAYVESCIEQYAIINRDVVYSSAILHDIGKVETYFFNEAGIPQNSYREKAIGHFFYAMHLVKKMGEKCKSTGANAIEPQFIEEVVHCIAAHHGSREWGSLVEPQTLEAGIVSRIDYLSSRNGKVYGNLCDTIKSHQPLPDEFNIYGDWYFTTLGLREFVKNRCL